MVIDSSAIVAILQGEPEAERFVIAIEADDVRLMAVPTILETSIVIERRRGEAGVRELDLILQEIAVDAVAFDSEHLRIARRAYRTYGRRNHRAGLNFGDCFSYALSRASGEPLLYKGADFGLTDVVAVL